LAITILVGCVRKQPAASQQAQSETLEKKPERAKELIESEQEAHPDLEAAKAIGRQAYGPAQPYTADLVDEGTLNTNMLARRRLAWRILEKSTEMVSLHGDRSNSFKIPLFMTWYTEKEFAQLIKFLYDEYGDSIAGRPGFSRDQIKKAIATVFSGRRTDSRDVSHDDVGAAGSVHEDKAKMAFSPSMVEHYLLFANEIRKCDPQLDDVNWVLRKKNGTSRTFSGCMSKEFPSTAVMIKTQWQKISDDRLITTDFRTDEKTMEELFSPTSNTDVMSGSEIEVPGVMENDKIFAIQDVKGEWYGLLALHVSTKEIDEWVWTTFWWSSTPNSDFGADRPQKIQNGWQNYKMCAATTFIEGDHNPASRFEAESLKSVLDLMTAADGPMATAQGVATWCANPYLEGDVYKKSCIGCHQAAGVDRKVERDPEVQNVNFSINHAGDFAFTFDSFKIEIERVFNE
tara:strand:+ start:558 stop:1931 length:1374 start_codon:yes stop_codon:yes gene_type:complete